MTVAFALALAAQVASTPVGEGMDVEGHLAYITFLLREGRCPVPGQMAEHEDVAAIWRHGFACDFLTPGTYARWAAASPDERAASRRWLRPVPTAPLVAPNYQAQHPPLYYLLAALAAAPMSSRPFDEQIARLSLLSVALGSLGFPALWLLFRRRFDAGTATALLLTAAWFPNLMPFLGRITNDALAFPVVCWFLVVIDRPRLSTFDVFSGAFLLVVGLVTKTYVLVLFPIFLVLCLLRGPGRGRYSWRGLALGVLMLLAGTAPLVVANLRSSGVAFPLLEATLTAGQPLWAKVAALFQIRWWLFLTLLVRGAFWSGYWSWVAPGPWFYLPVLAPLLLWLPRRAGRGPGDDRGWCRRWLRDAWVPIAALATFLVGMWWHAGLMALDAAVSGRSNFMGGEGWYFNVLLGASIVSLASAVRERFGVGTLARVARWSAVWMMVWHLIARLTVAAFWGGSVSVWSGLRFARAGEVLAALGRTADREAWQSWPGVFGPWWLTQVAPTVLALALSVWILAQIGNWRSTGLKCTM